jgi:hypothetical protein
VEVCWRNTQTKLKTVYLIPDRKLLLDDVEYHFHSLKNGELPAVQKTKKKLEEFSQKRATLKNYLIVLHREINNSILIQTRSKIFLRLPLM